MRAQQEQVCERTYLERELNELIEATVRMENELNYVLNSCKSE